MYLCDDASADSPVEKDGNVSVTSTANGITGATWSKLIIDNNLEGDVCTFDLIRMKV